MSSTPHGAAPAPAALSAFLRGVERRAALFGEFQCGDRALADTALAVAMRAFRNHAAGLPMADWPQRFWTLLVDTPPLRRSAPQAAWPAGLQALAGLQPRPRQALLLRLVAGLPEDTAAEVLGLAPAVHRDALSAACPRDADGRPDPRAWRRLADTLQQQLRELPPERLAALARLREAALGSARTSEPAAPRPSATWLQPKAKPNRRWPWALAVVLVSALALLATWYWPGGRTGITADIDDAGAGLASEPRIDVETLPPQPPAARFDADTALITHPDLALVLDPEAAALATQADFLAWYTAGRQRSAELQSLESTASNARPESASDEF